MARIDAPLLDHFECSFYLFKRDVVIDAPQFFRFISRTPNLQAPDKAHIGIISDDLNCKIWIDFSWPKQVPSAIRLGIYFIRPGWQILRLVQICRAHFSLLPTLEYLYMSHIGKGQILPQSRVGNVDNIGWLELLEPFTAVKNLYLTNEFASSFAHALQGLTGERATCPGEGFH